MLKIYNTIGREKQAFLPIEPGRVRMYVCGMTVYDYCHLGHARVMVVFDMVARWLRASDYAVTYVRNITDIDDKIIKRAAENGESMRALTDRFIAAMHEDADALGVLRPDHEPRATEFVPQMQSLIERLQDKGLAYRAASGDVNYSVRKFDGYGKLSGKSLDELRAGERVDVIDGKQDPLDFVLWKHAKPAEPADAKWSSPWGDGRPGWHIECSAMSSQLLGDHFDIHGGGADLQFPHHENEIAQSEGAHGHTFVNYWMHNGFVRVDDEKMSKSLGNFFTIREVLKQYDPEVVRFFILARALPQPAQLLRRPSRRCPRRTEPPVHDAEERTGRPMPVRTGQRRPVSDCAMRWTTISIRRKRWPCCSNCRMTPIAAATRPFRANCVRWPACSVCWNDLRKSSSKDVRRQADWTMRRSMHSSNSASQPRRRAILRLPTAYGTN
ncbi:cysteine--tRNA ligase [Methyloversatilis sp. RAC08]|nr:cysteine--tRNA ligase [Methyloversatilis sp. RAC08]